jgi:hypothetical protein
MKPAGKDGLSRDEITEARIEELVRELALAGAPMPFLSRAGRSWRSCRPARRFGCSATAR